MVAYSTRDNLLLVVKGYKLYLNKAYSLEVLLVINSLFVNIVVLAKLLDTICIKAQPRTKRIID